MLARTRRLAKNNATKDGGKQKPKKKKGYATTTCPTCGVALQSAGMLPQVRTPVPRSKREKYTLGCPKCGHNRKCHP